MSVSDDVSDAIKIGVPLAGSIISIIEEAIASGQRSDEQADAAMLARLRVVLTSAIAQIDEGDARILAARAAADALIEAGRHEGPT